MYHIFAFRLEFQPDSDRPLVNPARKYRNDNSLTYSYHVIYSHHAKQADRISTTCSFLVWMWDGINVSRNENDKSTKYSLWKGLNTCMFYYPVFWWAHAVFMNCVKTISMVGIHIRLTSNRLESICGKKISIIWSPYILGGVQGLHA